jgi:hypothetical protein
MGYGKPVGSPTKATGPWVGLRRTATRRDPLSRASESAATLSLLEYPKAEEAVNCSIYDSRRSIQINADRNLQLISDSRRGHSFAAHRNIDPRVG